MAIYQLVEFILHMKYDLFKSKMWFVQWLLSWGRMLLNMPVRQVYTRLLLSSRKFYGRHHSLTDRDDFSVSQIRQKKSRFTGLTTHRCLTNYLQCDWWCWSGRMCLPSRSISCQSLFLWALGCLVLLIFSVIVLYYVVYILFILGRLSFLFFFLLVMSLHSDISELSFWFDASIFSETTVSHQFCH